MAEDRVAEDPVVEDWARRLIETEDLDAKLDLGPPPRRWAAAGSWTLAPPCGPGRPDGVARLATTPRSMRRGRLRIPVGRAELLHRFLHHELQAAELMAWTLLAFPDADMAFRRGLLGVLLDELRHARGYRELLCEQHLCEIGRGARYGDFPIRDWFWERALLCRTPLQFVALMGIGLEGANLDHTQRFASAFRSVGAPQVALFLEQVGREEEAHVRFARRWFCAWTGIEATGDGADEFERWCAELVPPLGPGMFRGRPLDRPARLRAGQPPAFLDRLDEVESP